MKTKKQELLNEKLFDFEMFDTVTETQDKEPDWKQEWQGMPEFIQDKKEPYAKIIVRFDSEQDLQEFAKLINQKLTKKTKSIWYPFKSHWGLIKKVWVRDE